VGVDEIDRQHQELFRRVDALLKASLANDRSQVGPLLAYLREYVVVHFAAEERLMVERRYPGYRLHKVEHERFARDLAALEAAFAEKGATGDFSSRLTGSVADWLRDHVYLTDTAMGRFLKTVPETA
jgi:hemerythrin